MTTEERKQNRRLLAYQAQEVYQEGWRAADREELKKEYDLTDWEADVMVEELEKQASQYVEDEDGRLVVYAAAVDLMDDDIREQLHAKMAPCTNQEFYNAYVKAHAEKYNGEKFHI